MNISELIKLEIEQAKKSTEETMSKEWHNKGEEKLTKEQMMINGTDILNKDGEWIRAELIAGNSVSEIASHAGTYTRFIYAKMIEMFKGYFGDDIVPDRVYRAVLDGKTVNNTDIDLNGLTAWVRDGVINDKLKLKTWGRALEYIKEGVSIATACKANEVEVSDEFLFFMINRGVMEIGGKLQLGKTLESTAIDVVRSIFETGDDAEIVADRYDCNLRAITCMKAEYLRLYHDKLTVKDKKEFKVAELLCNGNSIADISKMLSIKDSVVSVCINNVVARTWDNVNNKDIACKLIEERKKASAKMSKERSNAGLTKGNMQTVMVRRRNGNSGEIPGMSSKVYSNIIEELKKRVSLTKRERDDIKMMIKETNYSIGDMMHRLVLDSTVIYPEIAKILIEDFGRKYISTLVMAKLERAKDSSVANLEILSEAIKDIRSYTKK